MEKTNLLYELVANRDILVYIGVLAAVAYFDRDDGER